MLPIPKELFTLPEKKRAEFFKRIRRIMRKRNLNELLEKNNK
jgi:hypothetical protein